MSSNVHYQFKSSKDFSTVAFEGSYISLGELKKAIITQKKLGKGTDFDLQITNAQTEEEYKDDAFLVPKNTSVIVCRMPATTGRQASFPPPAKSLPFVAPSRATAQTADISYAAEGTGELTGEPSADESEKIKELVSGAGGWLQQQPGSGSRYPRYAANNNNNNNNNRTGGEQPRIPPPTYVCHRCNLPGHYINHCPTNGDSRYDFHKVKKPTGIPRSFLKPVDAGTAKATLMMPGGGFAVMQPNEAPFQKIATRVNKPGLMLDSKDQGVPPELQCTMCNSLMKDAVLIPCCGYSFCDDCIRQNLIENELVCPMCKESNVSPDRLLPNKKLREAVDSYKRTLNTLPSQQQSLVPSQNSSVADQSVPDIARDVPGEIVTENRPEDPVSEEPSKQQGVSSASLASTSLQGDVDAQAELPHQLHTERPSDQLNDTIYTHTAVAPGEADMPLQSNSEPVPSAIPSHPVLSPTIPIPAGGQPSLGHAPIPIYGIPQPHLPPYRGHERRPTGPPRFGYDEAPYPIDAPPFFPPKNERLCFKCGGPGHLARNCPVVPFIGAPYEYGMPPVYDPRMGGYGRYPGFIDPDASIGMMPHRPARRRRSPSRSRSRSRSRGRSNENSTNRVKSRSRSRSPLRKKGRTTLSRSRSRSPTRNKTGGSHRHRSSRSPSRKRSREHDSHKPIEPPAESPSSRKHSKSKSPPPKRVRESEPVASSTREKKRGQSSSSSSASSSSSSSSLSSSKRKRENSPKRDVDSKRPRSHSTSSSSSQKAEEKRVGASSSTKQKKADNEERDQTRQATDRPDRRLNEDKRESAGARKDTEQQKGHEARVAAISKNRAGEAGLKDIPPLVSPRKGGRRGSQDTPMVESASPLPRDRKLDKDTAEPGSRQKQREHESTAKSQSTTGRVGDGKTSSVIQDADRKGRTKHEEKSKGPTMADKHTTKPQGDRKRQAAKEEPDRSSTKRQDKPKQDHQVAIPRQSKGAAEAVVQDSPPASKRTSEKTPITNSLKEGSSSSSSSSRPLSSKERSTSHHPLTASNDRRSHSTSSSASASSSASHRTSSGATSSARKERESNADTKEGKHQQPPSAPESEQGLRDSQKRGNKVLANFRLSIEQAARSVQSKDGRNRESDNHPEKKSHVHSKEGSAARPKKETITRKSNRGSESTQFLVTL